MDVFTVTRMRERWVARFCCAFVVLLLLSCSLFLPVLVTKAVAGSPIDACTLVTKAEAATVLSGAVKDVKSQYRSQEELKRLWDSLDEEQKEASRHTGLDPSSFIEDARCEYSTASDVSPTDLASYAGGSLAVLIGRARTREEAAKAFRRACSREGQPELTYKQLSGLGDSACAIEFSSIMVLKNDLILSLIHVLLSSGDVVTVDIKPLAVKAVSRLP